MNILGSLPPTNSPQNDLNKIDWEKILRFFLVQVGGLFLTWVPMIVGANYTYKGVNYTPLVVLAVSTLAEAVRRFLAGQKANP